MAAYLKEYPVGALLDDLDDALLAGPRARQLDVALAEGSESGLSHDGEQVGPVCGCGLVQGRAVEEFGRWMG